MAFASDARNLVSGDTNVFSDIFVKDRITGEVTLISSAADGARANNTSDMPRISGDGRYVTFASLASNLVSGGVSLSFQDYIKDRVTGAIELVSRNVDDVPGIGQLFGSTISADGRYVVFGSEGNIFVTSNALNPTVSGGVDTVQASISYVLAPRIENLTLTGTGNINGTGNALDNVITGNAGHNVLDGGTGVDTLIAGLGDDTYVVDSTSDTIIENAGGGTDTVQSSVTYSIAAVANVERVTLSGEGAINATGNDFSNVLVGNTSSNTLNGGAGNDFLVGGTGDDFYAFDTGFGQDTVFDFDPTSGNVDTIRFGSGMTSEAVIVEQVGINDHDIRLSFIGSADAVIMQGWLMSDDSKVERLEFADDVVWGVQNILNRITFHTQNHAPTLATQLADQAATADAAFSFTVPAEAFADVDAGDILSFTATRADGLTLPGWLAFDAATRTLSGTPGAADAGTLEVRVTATDAANASAADLFQLTVTGDEDDHNHDKRRKGNEGVGNGEDPPPPGHDHNQNDGPGAGPGNPGSRQQPNDGDRGLVRTGERDLYGSNSDSGHRDESIEELVQAYLERKPDYDFEALAWEPQRSPRREEVLNPLETARRWAQMHRYIDALGETDDEEARYGALTARRSVFGQDAADAGAGGIFGHAGSTGAAHAIANLRTLQGLEEGFTRLRT